MTSKTAKYGWHNKVVWDCRNVGNVSTQVYSEKRGMAFYGFFGFCIAGDVFFTLWFMVYSILHKFPDALTVGLWFIWILYSM